MDIATIGQYLPPTARHLPLERYVEPAEFELFRRKGLEMGFRRVESGALVRSSYHAQESFSAAGRLSFTMRKLAVIHHRFQDWVPALREAEPRLEIRGWHPRDVPDDPWIADAEGLFAWKLPPGLLQRMPRLAWIQNSGAGMDHLVGEHPGRIPITRADGQFGFWMARYTAAHLLSEAQRIDECRAAQRRAALGAQADPGGPHRQAGPGLRLRPDRPADRPGLARTGPGSPRLRADAGRTGSFRSIRDPSWVTDSRPTNALKRAACRARNESSPADRGRGKGIVERDLQQPVPRGTFMEERMATAVAPEEVEQLWIEFKRVPSNQELRNRLVEIYLPLVKYNGERIWARLPEGVELDDLISAGVFGLMDAIDAFDLSRGVKFETYCVPRIRGAMLDELRTMDWVPRLVRSKASKLNEAMKNLEARLGRQPNENELASELQISVPELEKMILDANAVNLISLNKKWYETDSYKDVREIDILEDKKGEDPTRRIQKNDLMRLVTKGLNRNERLIIILYYYEELTMKEIGATLDLSESRVSQMHSSIVQRLQGQLARRRPEFGS